MADQAVKATATIRYNSVSACPVTENKKFRKTARSTYEYFSSDQVTITQWNDRKPVMVASNFQNPYPLGSVKRFCRQEKRRTDVIIPHVIQNYNSGMGGVDLTNK